MPYQYRDSNPVYNDFRVLTLTQFTMILGLQYTDSNPDSKDDNILGSNSIYNDSRTHTNILGQFTVTLEDILGSNPVYNDSRTGSNPDSLEHLVSANRGI